MYKIEVPSAQNREEIFRLLLRLSSRKLFIDWKETNKTEPLVLKSSAKWAVDSHHDSKMRLRDIT